MPSSEVSVVLSASASFGGAARRWPAQRGELAGQRLGFGA